VFGPKFVETIYISEGNEARKVKSDAQVAIDKNQNPIFSLGVDEEDSAPNSNFSKLPSGIVWNEYS